MAPSGGGDVLAVRLMPRDRMSVSIAFTYISAMMALKTGESHAQLRRVAITAMCNIQFCSFQSRSICSYRVITVDRSVAAGNVRSSARGATCRVGRRESYSVR